MRRVLVLLVIALFLLDGSVSLHAQPCREVIGYYPNWQWYDRNKLVDPFSLNYPGYTILNYAFFKPEADGSISSTDAWADENLLLGEINWSTTPPTYYPNTSLIDRAHNSGVKVLVSIGGWTLSGAFPGIASDSVKRAIFASECNRLVDSIGFDGVDLDWEYPGYLPHGGSPADKANFTRLLQQVRDSLDALELKMGKSLMLTSCFGASPDNASHIEWNTVVPLLDHINLMTYDFFGAWDCMANHNAPLYAPASGNPAFNLDAAFTMLVNQYGVPASKINLGLAFYGRSQINATVLHAPTGCLPDNQTFPDDLGSPLYYNIVQKLTMFSSHWDTLAQVPYLVGLPSGPAASTFVSYDDPVSIARKAQYVVDKQAGGVIIWEVTGDYLETSPGSGIIAGTPLLDTINAVFCANPVVGNPDNADLHDPCFRPSIWPNPSHGSLTLSVESLNGGPLQLNLFSLSSQHIHSETIYILAGSQSIQWPVPSFVKPGIYILQLYHNHRHLHLKLILGSGSDKRDLR